MNLFLYLFSCFCGIFIGVLGTVWYFKHQIEKNITKGRSSLDALSDILDKIE